MGSVRGVGRRRLCSWMTACHSQSRMSSTEEESSKSDQVSEIKEFEIRRQGNQRVCGVRVDFP